MKSLVGYGVVGGKEKGIFVSSSPFLPILCEDGEELENPI